ncbi:MAG: FliO/MopB family protein [Halanaerobiales bacterium]
MNLTLEFLQIVMALILVLGLIYVIAYFMKNRMMSGKSKHIMILERVYISPKINLSLVRAKNRVLLLGISSEGIELLESWPSEEFEDLETEEDKNFKDYIQEFMNKPGSFYARRDNNDKK